MAMDTPESFLDTISYQPRVHKFLKGAFENDKLSHAYLFCGAQGAGMNDAAMTLACTLGTKTSRLHNSHEVNLIHENNHPDIRIYEPQGRDGYLVEQVREIMSQAELSPVMCGWKIYIIHDAHRLTSKTANALLKTIEEPPAHTMFIFIAPAIDAVLPTIASRCQLVPFPALDINARAKVIQERIPAAEIEDCKIALHVTGSVEGAIVYLASDERRELRRFVINAMEDLDRMSVADVLGTANTWCTLAKECFDEDVSEQEDEEREAINKEYLSRGALTQLEKAHKREVASRAVSGMIESLVYAELFLRDVMLYREQVLSDNLPVAEQARRTQIVSLINSDFSDQVDFVARRTTSESVLKALDHIAQARRAIMRSMSLQLTMEVMLIHIKEALYALGNTR